MQGVKNPGKTSSKLSVSCRWRLEGVAEYGLVKLMKEVAGHCRTGQDLSSFPAGSLRPISVRNAVHSVGQVSRLHVHGQWHWLPDNCRACGA